jgi:aryl-alcohol dehydrogenase-like predicted oxidoreductase
MSATTAGVRGVGIGPIGLGAWLFGWDVPADEARRILAMAADRGIAYVDTANNYGSGASERVVGAFLRGRRERVVLGTKVYAPFGPGPADRGLSASAVRRAVDLSLRRLGTDHVDILYLHRPDRAVAPSETAAALVELWQAGKIRSVGTSTFRGADIDAIQRALAAAGGPPAVCDQAPYSLLERSVEVTALDAVRRWAMDLVVWSPLAEGLLTGKYGDATAQGRLRRWNVLHQPRFRDGVRRAHDFQALARSHGLTLQQLALRWLVRRPGVRCVLTGPRTADQLGDYLDAVDGPLPTGIDDEVDAIVGSGETALHHYDT